MENSGFAKVRLEDEGNPNGPRWNLIIPTVALIASVLLGGSLSYFSPDEYDTIRKTTPPYNLTETKWDIHLENMTPENQQILLLSRESNPIRGEHLINQTYNVDVWGSNFPVKEAGKYTCLESSCRNCSYCEHISHTKKNASVVCESGADYCDWKVDYFTRQIRYPTYYFEVDVLNYNITKDGKENFQQAETPQLTAEFDVYFKNADYTRFHFRVSFCFFIITLVFMFLPKIGFFYQLIKLQPRFWSKQQEWIAVLLVGLLLFNNPLIHVPAHTSWQYKLHLHESTLIVDITFICVLIYFWLLIFTDMARDGTAAALSGDRATWHQRKSTPFLQAIRTREAILVALIWLSSMLMYGNKQFHEASGSPLDENYFLSDSLVYNVAKVLRIVGGLIYIVWMLFLIFRTARLVRSLSIEYRMIYGATVFTLLCTSFGVLWDKDMIDPKGSFFFASIYNGYVLTLAWCYTLVGTRYLKVDVNEIELSGVEEWMEDDALSDEE